MIKKEQTTSLKIIIGKHLTISNASCRIDGKDQIGFLVIQIHFTNILNKYS